MSSPRSHGSPQNDASETQEADKGGGGVPTDGRPGIVVNLNKDLPTSSQTSSNNEGQIHKRNQQSKSVPKINQQSKPLLESNQQSKPVGYQSKSTQQPKSVTMVMSHTKLTCEPMEVPDFENEREVTVAIDSAIREVLDECVEKTCLVAEGADDELIQPDVIIIDKVSPEPEPDVLAEVQDVTMTTDDRGRHTPEAGKAEPSEELIILLDAQGPSNQDNRASGDPWSINPEVVATSTSSNSHKVAAQMQSKERMVTGSIIINPSNRSNNNAPNQTTQASPVRSSRESLYTGAPGVTRREPNATIWSRQGQRVMPTPMGPSLVIPPRPAHIITPHHLPAPAAVPPRINIASHMTTHSAVSISSNQGAASIHRATHVQSMSAYAQGFDLRGGQRSIPKRAGMAARPHQVFNPWMATTAQRLTAAQVVRNMRAASGLH